MDKETTKGIDNFLEYFSKQENQVLFDSSRYLTTETKFAEEAQGHCLFRETRMPPLTLLEVSFDLRKDLWISAKSPEEEISSVFVLEGEFTSRFEGITKNVAPVKLHHNILYSTDYSSDHQFKQGKFQAVHLSYDVSFFKSLLDVNDPRFQTILAALENEKPVLLSEADLPLQMAMVQSIKDIKQCHLQGTTRNLYLEAKALELLTLQMEQLLATNAGSNKKEHRFSPADIEKLHLVKEFIQTNFLQRITLSELALRFGLNEFKLKSGYKKLFGSPIYSTIHHLRMQTAADLLKNNIMNISEVTDFVGYSNISHFSAAFKKKFGYSPSISRKLLSN